MLNKLPVASAVMTDNKLRTFGVGHPRGVRESIAVSALVSEDTGGISSGLDDKNVASASRLSPALSVGVGSTDNVMNDDGLRSGPVRPMPIGGTGTTGQQDN